MPKQSESGHFLEMVHNHSELENFLVGDQVISEDKKKWFEMLLDISSKLKSEERKLKKIKLDESVANYGENCTIIEIDDINAAGIFSIWQFTVQT